MTDLTPETPGHTYGCSCEPCAKFRQTRSYERHLCLIAEWHDRPGNPRWQPAAATTATWGRTAPPSARRPYVTWRTSKR